MNYYVVVEGERTEPLVYRNWIPFVNSKLRYVESIRQVSSNNFIIISGYGYPFYLEVIDGAIDDVNDSELFDRLVIAVDSEEMTFEEKLNEIENHLSKKKCKIPIRIIVQHFCIETWALGNKSIISRNIQDPTLLEYINIHNVVESDPELLPNYNDLNRSQFAFKYLKKAINEKHRNLSYSKDNVEIIANNSYFTKVRKRLYDTEHIKSFKTFLNAFRP
jgi:hypothetical protein